MKKILLLACAISFSACQFQQKAKAPEEQAAAVPSEVKNIYQFTVQDIDGNEFKLSDLRGQKIMIVNTASECGFTPQYADLEELYQKYKQHNFTIIGFPSNDFKGQEPGSNAEIKKFCTSRFNVSFPMMGKINVVGKEQAPLYRFLTQKSENGVMDAPVKWNFQKFLINEDGSVARVYESRVKPTDAEILKWIEQ
ncbi:glutathione peroxidase [Ornithobacterium rhinotracheale]|uniref:Glutathione peroxidase n=1 Tax=Ornithobacterium rhinotracheale TaxID=28251 RepID=A0A3R5YVQ2_ORNRH|nr:glutathione peroxidase [Ornithobacterium rhinotracheale]QAR30607.1 glutathione peroxidase [Ornithobacterium rhinotracheale]